MSLRAVNASRSCGLELGEPINVCGPGTYDDECGTSRTRAGAVDASEIIPQDVNVRLGVDCSVACGADPGAQRVRMASCAALEPELLRHLVWFHYRSKANIHPQYKTWTAMLGPGAGGRGAERGLLRSLKRQRHLGPLPGALVLGRGVLFRGSRWQILADQAQDLGAERRTDDGVRHFAVMYDMFIDEAYASVRAGPPSSDASTSTRESASCRALAGQLFETIQDDSIASNALRCGRRKLGLRRS